MSFSIEDCQNSSQCLVLPRVYVNLQPTNYTLSTEVVEQFLKGVGRLFYIVKPSETTFENPNDVPKFFYNVSDILSVFISIYYNFKALLLLINVF